MKRSTLKNIIAVIVKILEFFIDFDDEKDTKKS